MSTPVILEERIISGTGLLLVPPDKLGLRQYYLDAQVYRPPSNSYLSRKSNPTEGFFARLCFINTSEGNQGVNTVVERADMTFVNQRFVFTPDLAGQALLSLKCANKATLDSFVNLVKAVADALFPRIIAPLSVTYPIADHKVLQLQWDTIRCVCYNDCAVKLTLSAVDYDACLPQDKQEQPPPPPRQPLPQQPPATSIPLDQPQVSPPYAQPDDGGITEPYFLDEPEEPTLPVCTDVNIAITVTRTIDNFVDDYTFTVVGKAPVINVYLGEFVSNGSSAFVIDSLGANNTCLSTPAAKKVNRGIGTWSNVRYTVTPR